MKNICCRLLYLCIAVLTISKASAQQDDYKEYRPLLIKNATQLRASAADIKEAVITNAYTDPASKITFVYLQQTYGQIRVFNTIISAAFRDDKLLYSSGSFVKDMAHKAGDGLPRISCFDAVKSAERYLGLNEETPVTVADNFAIARQYALMAPRISRKNIEVTLFWTPLNDKKQVALSWNVNIKMLNGVDWWNVRIDANTGDFIEKDNWSANEQIPEADGGNKPAPPVKASATYTDVKKQSVSRFIKQETSFQNVLQSPPPNVASATYRVIPFPGQSPLYDSFSTVSNPWLMAGAGNNATTLGWHSDNVANYTITRGNNVFAFLDRRNTDVADPVRNWPDTSSTDVPNLNFVHNINPAHLPFLDVENKKAALDNLFYWINLMHDVSYQYGFTEAAGNFQANNLARGGQGNDFVLGQAQDSAGYNNANFASPPDGQNGEMQMYLWTGGASLTVSSPSSLAGAYPSVEGSFSPNNRLSNVGPVTGKLVYFNDDTTAGSSHNACGTAAANSLTGKIALIDRSVCSFTQKVKNAQLSGAIAAIIVNNVPGAPQGMGGSDTSIKIPAVMVSQNTGAAFAAQLDNDVIITLSAGKYFDGDFDDAIISHEYGHGISLRLTGGAGNGSCLDNAEQAGEGWSDYLGLMMTTNWNTAGVNDGAQKRPVGNYVFGQTKAAGGIRRYPYSTDMNVDPLTYADMKNNPEIHATGEIWCSALWDMTWNLIQQQNAITGNLYNNAGTGGNVISMNLVITGLKLQPCNPGFLDSRDAILAADSILYNSAHRCAIWKAFARRGMGVSASEGSYNSPFDQVAAFDLPGINLNTPTQMIVSAGSAITVTHTATCQCTPATAYVLKDTIPAGFTYTSSTPSGSLSGSVLSFPPTAFGANETKDFSIVLQAPVNGCVIDTVISDNRETSVTGGFASSGIHKWTTSNEHAYSDSLSWHAAEPDITSSSSLSSAASAGAVGKELSIFSFQHFYNTEPTYDGGVVEYSLNGGAWEDAGPLFIRNGYTAKMDTTTLLNGRRAFSGNHRYFSPSIIDASSFGTAPVSFRFRMVSDEGTGGDGWYVDNIVRANGCGGILKTGLYDNFSLLRDEAKMPVFVTPGTLPLTLLWFYAVQSGTQVSLDWKTVAEKNVRNFAIEWSTNGTQWTEQGISEGQNRSANYYHFQHVNPATGDNFYRIKMNDRDGRFTYSPVRVVHFGKTDNTLLVLVPNPVNDNAILYIPKKAKATNVKIYDAKGSLVRRYNMAAEAQQLKIETADLPSGLYTIQTNGTSAVTITMLVQH